MAQYRRKVASAADRARASTSRLGTDIWEIAARTTWYRDAPVVAPHGGWIPGQELAKNTQIRYVASSLVDGGCVTVPRSNLLIAAPVELSQC